MPTPVGPLFAAGNQVITKSGHRIRYWPDAHNALLQSARHPSIYVKHRAGTIRRIPGGARRSAFFDTQDR